MAGASQFGLDRVQAATIARECSASWAQFVGLHFYFGSQRLKSEPIEHTLHVVAMELQALREMQVKPVIVDVGLGCGVPYLEKDQALDYDALRGRLRSVWEAPIWNGTDIWSEAGRSLVGQSGYFVARVIDRKQLHGKTFVFRGRRLERPQSRRRVGRFFRSNPRFRFITSGDGSMRETVDIVGNLCTSADCIGQGVDAPRLAEGDLIVIPNSGAYTQTTGLLGFNSQRPYSEALLEVDGTLRCLEPQYQPGLNAAFPVISV